MLGYNSEHPLPLLLPLELATNENRNTLYPTTSLVCVRERERVGGERNLRTPATAATTGMALVLMLVLDSQLDKAPLAPLTPQLPVRLTAASATWQQLAVAVAATATAMAASGGK